MPNTTWFPEMCCRFALALLVIGLLVEAPAALGQDAQPGNQPRFYPFAPPSSGGTDPGSSGVAAVIIDSNGPDMMVAWFRGLAPRTCYATFLTQNAMTGSTPGSLLASFCADDVGQGRVQVLTEIVDSFVFFNRRLDMNGNGVVIGQAAGVTANGGFTVPTPIVRVYRAQPDMGVETVFSAASGTPGGLHTLSSAPIR